MKKRIHVVAAVITDKSGKILIAKRPAASHLGGLWEFPGGKSEPGEAAVAALARELLEELGIEIASPQPLLQVAHDYPEKSVLLDVWRVDSFSGVAHGAEGQEVRWVAPSELTNFQFPAANTAIVEAAKAL